MKGEEGEENEEERRSETIVFCGWILTGERRRRRSSEMKQSFGIDEETMK